MARSGGVARGEAEWACAVIRFTTQRILHLASNWIADDEFHDKQNEVVRFVRGQGGAVNQNTTLGRWRRWVR